jgi:hypothetical protein
MSEKDTEASRDHPRVDDRNEEIDDSPVPDPEGGTSAEDKPEAD